MENSEDKQWVCTRQPQLALLPTIDRLTTTSQASRYLLDPLHAPEPSAETGPGTHYNSTFAPQPEDHSSSRSPTEAQKPPTSSIRSSNPSSSSSSSSSKLQKTPPSVSVRSANRPSSQKPTPPVSDRSSNNPYRNASSTAYPSPPQSASPRTDRFSTSTYRQEAFPDFDGSYSPTPTRQSIDQASTQIPTSTGGQHSTTTDGHRRRGSSLTQRFPGDQSHRPLDMIKRDAKLANRHPHLRKKHIVGSDTIDRMDTIGGFHHDGPYDATLLARNISNVNSPVEAVRTTNAEALRATPHEMIQDSVQKHRPLDGVAMVPPGMEDRYGNVYHYEEGTDMMIENSPEGGAYKRWPGVVRSPYIPNPNRHRKANASFPPAIPPRRPQRQRRTLLLPRKRPQAPQTPLPPRIRRHQRHRNDHPRRPTATDECGGPIEARERRAKVRGLGAGCPSERERGGEAEEEVREHEDPEGGELKPAGTLVL